MLTYKLRKKLIRIAQQNIDQIDSRFKHFSFLIKRNKIICYGWNHGFKTHPWAIKHRFYAIHSEIDVIRNFPFRPKFLSDYTLINIRLCHGLLTIAKPCIRCQQLLNHFGVVNVIYSNYQGDFVKL